MTTDTKPPRQERKVIYRGAASAPVYALGLIGALAYYLGQATTFWVGALGFLKALVWPAMLVYEVLKFVHM